MNELYHYGVKGMKWGKRKFTGKSHSIFGATVDKTGPVEEARRRSEELRNRTDPGAKLKKRTKMRRETTLNELSKKNKAIKLGSEFVKDMMKAEPWIKRS